MRPPRSFSLPGIDVSLARSFPSSQSAAASASAAAAAAALDSFTFGSRGHENSHAGIQLPNERRLEGAPKIPRLEQVRYYRIDACDVAQIALIHLIFWENQ